MRRSRVTLVITYVLLLVAAIALAQSRPVVSISSLDVADTGEMFAVVNRTPWPSQFVYVHADLSQHEIVSDNRDVQSVVCSRDGDFAAFNTTSACFVHSRSSEVRWVHSVGADESYVGGPSFFRDDRYVGIEVNRDGVLQWEVWELSTNASVTPEEAGIGVAPDSGIQGEKSNTDVSTDETLDKSALKSFFVRWDGDHGLTPVEITRKTGDGRHSARYRFTRFSAQTISLLSHLFGIVFSIWVALYARGISSHGSIVRVVFSVVVVLSIPFMLMLVSEFQTSRSSIYVDDLGESMLLSVFSVAAICFNFWILYPGSRRRVWIAILVSCALPVVLPEMMFAFWLSRRGISFRRVSSLAVTTHEISEGKSRWQISLSDLVLGTAAFALMIGVGSTLIDAELAYMYLIGCVYVFAAMLATIRAWPRWITLFGTAYLTMYCAILYSVWPMRTGHMGFWLCVPLCVSLFAMHHWRLRKDDTAPT